MIVEKSQLSPFTKRDVLKMIKKAKVDSAPGPDGVNNETLCIFGEVIAHLLTCLFSILFLGSPPAQWLESKIILIYKKGSFSDVNNYRPISLSLYILKIFMVIPKNKCYNRLDAH